MLESVPSTGFSYFSDNLRLYRLARRMTQRQLALGADLSQGYVCRLERGLRPSRSDHIDRLAAALDVDPSTLLRRSRQIPARRAISAHEAGR